MFTPQRNKDKYYRTAKRIQLNSWQKLGYYSFMFLPLIIPFMEMYSALRNVEVDKSFPISYTLICVSLSMLIGYFKWRQLVYYETLEIRTDYQFKEAVYAAAADGNWKIVSIKNNSVEAEAYSYLSRDPQKITIERSKHSVKINSMIEPGILSVPDFFGANRTNIGTFFFYYLLSDRVENLVDQVTQDWKAEEQRIENEPEWNLKNTFKRLIAYCFSLIFFIGGIALWKYEGFNIGVPFLLIFGSFYIVFDVYVMITKWKRKKSDNSRP